MRTTIKIHSIPHRRIAVADILPNPHRDLKANPIREERVEELIDSYGRTGFWDNIVVRQHPTRADKYELAAGHNRLAGLKDKRVEVETITIPVAKLTDWDMYVSMVDENELSGKMTPEIAFENLNVGCDIIEKAFKKIGREGTWEEFNQEMGRSVSVDTERGENDHGFEKVRAAFFEGEGLGRAFLTEFLPGGRMRANTISTILASRYGEKRAAVKTEKAKKKRWQATSTRQQAWSATDVAEATRLQAQADAEEAEARKLEEQADRIGRGSVSSQVLLMFNDNRTMTDFAEAVRRLHIPKEQHFAAAEHVIRLKVKEERIERELDLWWDEVGGAARRRREAGERRIKEEKLLRLLKGVNFNAFLSQIASDLRGKDTDKRLRIAIEYIDQAEARGHQIVADRLVPIAELLNTLIDRSQATVDATAKQPAQQMLSHQKG